MKGRKSDRLTRKEMDFLVSKLRKYAIEPIIYRRKPHYFLAANPKNLSPEVLKYIKEHKLTASQRWLKKHTRFENGYFIPL